MEIVSIVLGKFIIYYLTHKFETYLSTKAWNLNCFPILSYRANKDWGLKKLTNFAFGHFTSISGHFIANYINIFHKSVVLMVILRG